MHKFNILKLLDILKYFFPEVEEKDEEERTPFAREFF